MRCFFLTYTAFRLIIGMIVALLRERDPCHRKKTKTCVFERYLSMPKSRLVRTKIFEKLERATTLHRDSRGGTCGRRRHYGKMEGPWKIREEEFGIRGQSLPRLHTRTGRKSCVESSESYRGRLWMSICCEAQGAASCRHYSRNRRPCDSCRDETSPT